jgi:hypothetical protein
MRKPFDAIRKNYRRRVFEIAVQAVRTTNGDPVKARALAEENVRVEYGSILLAIVLGVLIHYAVKAVVWLIDNFDNLFAALPEDTFDRFEKEVDL